MKLELSYCPTTWKQQKFNDNGVFYYIFQDINAKETFVCVDFAENWLANKNKYT
jgi:hypothetical protein